jgi:tRNA(fMet)-specific endonuclease VapC
MAERYMLDTNILSALIQNPDGVAAERASSATRAGHIVCTSIIVAAESRFGATKKGSIKIQRRIEELFEEIDVLPLASNADEHYANLRVDLERMGQPIGGNDMLIAAHALAADAILVTHNTREFQRVKGLRIEDWLSAARSGGEI